MRRSQRLKDTAPEQTASLRVAPCHALPAPETGAKPSRKRVARSVGIEGGSSETELAGGPDAPSRGGAAAGSRVAARKRGRGRSRGHPLDIDVLFQQNAERNARDEEAKQRNDARSIATAAGSGSLQEDDLEQDDVKEQLHGILQCADHIEQQLKRDGGGRLAEDDPAGLACNAARGRLFSLPLQEVFHARRQGAAALVRSQETGAEGAVSASHGDAPSRKDKVDANGSTPVPQLLGLGLLPKFLGANPALKTSMLAEVSALAFTEPTAMGSQFGDAQSIVASDMLASATLRGPHRHDDASSWSYAQMLSALVACGYCPLLLRQDAEAAERQWGTTSPTVEPIPLCSGDCHAACHQTGDAKTQREGGQASGAAALAAPELEEGGMNGRNLLALGLVLRITSAALAGSSAVALHARGSKEPEERQEAMPPSTAATEGSEEGTWGRQDLTCILLHLMRLLLVSECHSPPISSALRRCIRATLRALLAAWGTPNAARPGLPAFLCSWVPWQRDDEPGHCGTAADQGLSQAAGQAWALSDERRRNLLCSSQLLLLTPMDLGPGPWQSTSATLRRDWAVLLLTAALEPQTSIGEHGEAAWMIGRAKAAVKDVIRDEEGHARLLQSLTEKLVSEFVVFLDGSSSQPVPQSQEEAQEAAQGQAAEQAQEEARHALQPDSSQPGASQPDTSQIDPWRKDLAQAFAAMLLLDTAFNEQVLLHRRQQSAPDPAEEEALVCYARWLRGASHLPTSDARSEAPMLRLWAAFLWSKYQGIVS